MKKTALTIICFTSFLFCTAQTTESQFPPAEKNRIIKLDFFAPITGNLTFGYEQALQNNITLDGELGIIGIGVIEDSYHPAGMFLKAGTKLYFSPDYMIDGMRRTNDFQGSYFKPEIIYSGFSFDYDRINNTTGYYYTDRGSNHSFALMLNFGKQWVIGKIVSIEGYGGLGYGFSIVNADDASGYDEIVSYKYSHVQVSNDVPLAFSAGLNIGLLLR